MIESVDEMEALKEGSILAIFLPGEPGIPKQVALKTDTNEWAIGGQPKPWLTRQLFDSISRENCILQPVWLVR